MTVNINVNGSLKLSVVICGSKVVHNSVCQSEVKSKEAESDTQHGTTVANYSPKFNIAKTQRD